MGDDLRRGGSSGSAIAFLNDADAFLRETTAFFRNREDESEPARRRNQAAAASMSGLHDELARLREAVTSQPAVSTALERVLATSAAPAVLAAQREVAQTAATRAEEAEAREYGMATVEMVLKKAKDLLPPPFDKLVGDAIELLAWYQKMTKSTGDEVKRIERKLESLQQSVNGAAFPAGDAFGPIPAGAKALRAEIAELEAKLEELYADVFGVPLKDASGNIVSRESGAPIAEPSRNSLWWLATDLERKLENVFARIVGDAFVREPDTGLVAPPVLVAGAPPDVIHTLRELKQKVDNLAKLLGRTLYDSSWNVEPEEFHGITTQEKRPPNQIPTRSIKDEIHDLELWIKIIIKILIPRLKPPDVTVVELPEDFDLTLIPEGIKRIYVYDQGVFSATAAQQERLVEIRTAAFDLAGWVDLTELRDGDEVSISVYVNLPGPVRRARSATYRDSADAGLKSLQDVVGSGTILVGNAIDVVISHDVSASAFAVPLRIAYQFVVESQ